MDEEALTKKARIEVKVEDTNSNKNLVCNNNKCTLLLPLSSVKDNSIEEIIKKDIVKLIDFLQEQNLFLNNKHLEILYEDSSNEFKNSIIEIFPTIAKLDIKLLSDNLNKII
ncbi:4662_t:CDS:2, partial [Dentiscutata erythropus]